MFNDPDRMAMFACDLYELYNEVTARKAYNNPNLARKLWLSVSELNDDIDFVERLSRQLRNVCNALDETYEEGYEKSFLNWR